MADPHSFGRYRVTGTLGAGAMFVPPFLLALGWFHLFGQSGVPLCHVT